MSEQVTSNHFFDDNGNPEGGASYGAGFAISWQRGPLLVDGVRTEPNGAFVESILLAALDRLEFYQRSKFSCEYNSNAIKHIKIALAELNSRTADRENRGVEGTCNE